MPPSDEQDPKPENTVLTEANAPNYVTATVTTRDGREIEMTIRPTGNRTPHEMRERAEARLRSLIEAVAPRLRTTATGFRYCPACQREWAHDAPVESHRDGCALVAAREAVS